MSRPAFTTLSSSQYGNQYNIQNNNSLMAGSKQQQQQQLPTTALKQPQQQQQQTNFNAFSTPMQTPKLSLQTPASKISLGPIPMAAPLSSSIFQPTVIPSNSVRSTISNIGQTTRYSSAPTNQPKMSVGITSSLAGSSTANNKKSIPSVSIRPTATRAESRPISDKEFQRQCVHRIITFLTTNNYPSQITQKTMKAPSQKEFYSIIEFLFHQIDPTFKFTQGKQEDELIAFFKIMRYPFSISKRNLTSVAAPHTWPHLLGALSWMVELIEYDNAVEHDIDSESEQLQGDDAFYREFNCEVIRSYQDHYLHGNNESGDSFLEEHHGSRNRRYTDEINHMIETINQQRIQIEEIQAEPIITGELRESLVMTNNSVLRNQELINKVNSQKALVEQSIETHSQECGHLDVNLADLQQRKTSLEEILSEQQKSSVDAKMINQRRVQLQDDITKTLNERKRLERAKQDKITEINKIISMIDECILQFNEHTRNFDKDSSDFKIEFDSNGEITISDLKKVKKYLKTYIEDQYEKTNTTEEDINTKKSDIKKLEGDIADRQQQKKRSEQKLANIESTSNREKEKLDKEIQTLAKKVEMRELDNKQLKENLKDELNFKTIQLQEIQLKLEKQREHMHSSLNDLKGNVMQYLVAIANHQESVSKTVISVLDHMNQHCKST